VFVAVWKIQIMLVTENFYYTYRQRREEQRFYLQNQCFFEH